MRIGNHTLLSIFLCVGLAVCYSHVDNSLEEELADVADDDTNSTTGAPPVPPTTTPVVPSDDKFVVTNTTTGHVCLLVAFNASFRLPYIQTDGKTGIATVDFQRALSSYTGSCSDDSDIIDIAWKPRTDAAYTWSILMIFSPIVPRLLQSADDGKFKLGHFTLGYYLDNVTFPNTNYAGRVSIDLKTPENLVKGSAGETYHCEAERSSAFDGRNVTVGEFLIKLRNLRVDAFRLNRTDTNFSDKEWLCDEDLQLSFVVPLVIGVILAVLVIVGIVAYFLGRHKTSRSSYQSM